MARLSLKSVEFRREREASWRELDALVSRVETNGLASLSADELLRLPSLYRAALAGLSVARAISLDRNVVAYLEGLASRAYFSVYATRTSLVDVAADFFSRRFPAAVRSARYPILIAAGLLLLGTWAGWQMVVANQDNFYIFVSDTLAAGRGPGAGTEALRDGLYNGDRQAFGSLQSFATYLFVHNARIGILAFALGFALGLPVFYLLISNGLMLGAFAALYHGRGLGLDLWGWLLPHGITELLAVALCGGAGLRIAEALVLPGRHGRLENLAIHGKSAALIVLGAVAMFLVAGVIEGIFRQAVQSIEIRYLMALATALFWVWYFGFAGRHGGA